MKKFISVLTAFVLVLSVAIGSPIYAEENMTNTSGEVVAKIGDKEYSELTKAIEEANDQEIELLTNTEIKKDSFINSTRKVTLDLNGFSINCGQNSFVSEGDATFILLDSVGGGEINGTWPIYVRGNGTFTMESGTINGQWYAVTGNGSKDIQGSKGTTININGGKLYQNDPNDPHCAAIYHPQKGVLNINGGEITGSVGIQLCAGGLNTVNMNGGVVRGVGKDVALEKPESDGCIGDGAAISVLDRNYPGGAPYVNIKGGTFISEQSESILAYSIKKENQMYVREDWKDAAEHVVVLGGMFSSDVNSFVGEGYRIHKLSDNEYKVIPVTTGISLDQTTLTLNTTNKKEATLNATLTPGGAMEELIWESSNTNVATVDTTGKVIAKGLGTATITVRTSNGLVATCVVTVEEIKEIEIDVPSIDTSKPVENVEVGMPNEKETQSILNDSIAQDKLLQDAITKAQMNGETVTITPTIEKIDVKTASAEVKQDIAKADVAAKKQKLTITDYLDLSIIVKANDRVLGKITETTNELTFQVAIPQKLLKENRKFYVIRVHDGETEILDVLEKDGIYTFKTDKFSTYALAYRDVNSIPSEKEETPNTGDYTMLAAYGMLVLVSTALLIVLKKKADLTK